MLAVERCACGCAACDASVPAGLDLGCARETDLGLYHVEFADVPTVVDAAATLTIVVTRRHDPAPVDAHIAVTGGRPRCRCAAPADLTIIRRALGRFETAPFAITSPGWWVIRVTVSGEAGFDGVTFNLAIG